jgi:hypothetical protein
VFLRQKSEMQRGPDTLEAGITSSLCPYEIEILEECAGLRPAAPWGAAVGAALETLRGAGFLTGNRVTEKGYVFIIQQKALKNRRKT